MYIGAETITMTAAIKYMYDSKNYPDLAWLQSHLNQFFLYIWGEKYKLALPVLLSYINDYITPIQCKLCVHRCIYEDCLQILTVGLFVL